MQTTLTHMPQEKTAGDLATPVRNHYFYGKLLDVFHFELETSYMNAKRWLLNHQATGYGVVCGLDVILTKDRKGVYVTAGLALDGQGREIIVPGESGPYPFPDQPAKHAHPHKDEPEKRPYPAEHPGQAGYGEKGDRPAQSDTAEPYEEPDVVEMHLVVCYHECRTQPTPVLSGDCDGEIQCAPGLIEERFRVEFRPGLAPPISLWDCHIPDAVVRGELDYEVLVRWVTDMCPPPHADPCVPLANIRLTLDPDGPTCAPEDVDINIRPLALSNDALFYLILSMLFEAAPRRRGR